MITDRHPLATQQTALTDALNATFITNNGNEGLVLNDMGNTLIQDSTTGSIMLLSSGFIPVGMKEYGGVLYIASYNKNTKEGELGTIPSPLIKYDILDNEVKSGEHKFIDNEFSNCFQNAIKEDLYIISKTKLFPGDLFMLKLPISTDIGTFNLTRKCWDNQLENNLPLVTKFVNTVEKKGIYKINLYSVVSSGRIIKLTGLKQQLYYTLKESIDGEPELKTSDYWFISNPQDSVDNEMSLGKNLYLVYPNIPSGYLAVRAELEYPENIDIIDPFVYYK